MHRAGERHRSEVDGRARQQVGQHGVVDHERGLGVAEHEVPLLGQQRRVERHRHHADPQRAEHRRQHGPAAGRHEGDAVPRPDATGGQGSGDPALQVLGGLGREQLDGHRGRSPVARRVLPVSRKAAMVRWAMRIWWISSAPSAKRAQRACWYMWASGVSVE